MSDWEERTVSCNPQDDKKMRIDVSLWRKSDPPLISLFNGIFHWGDFSKRRYAWGPYNAFYPIRMVPGAADRKYQGTCTGYWKDLDMFDPPMPDAVSRMDLWLTVKDPPEESELRFVFTFKVIQEFDCTVKFLWESWRTVNSSNRIDVPPYVPTSQHKLTEITIWYTDNMEAVHPANTPHEGQVLILGEP